MVSRNIELKARYADLAAGQRVARSIGATLHAVERQRDTYFRASVGRLKLRERWICDENGLVQQASPSQLIGYDRADAAAARPSDYSLVVVHNAAELRALLATSLGVTVVVDKLRTVYLHDHVRMHLDDVAGLGSFLEFEAVVDDSCDDKAAYAKLARLEQQFGVVPADILSQSYAELSAVERATRGEQFPR